MLGDWNTAQDNKNCEDNYKIKFENRMKEKTVGRLGNLLLLLKRKSILHCQLCSSRGLSELETPLQ